MNLLNNTPQNKTFIISIFLMVLFSVQISCSKDSEVFREAVLGDPETELPDDVTSEDSSDLVSRTVVLTPISDAYVQDDTGRNLRIIRLEENRRKSYLKFDLSNLSGTVTDAALEFTVDADRGNGTIEISKGSSITWTEDNLNSSNAPSEAELLGTFSDGYDLGELKNIILDASNLFSEETSFVLNHRNGNDFAMASKENPSVEGPKLIVTYEADAETIAADIARDQSENNGSSDSDGSEDQNGNDSSGGDNTGDSDGGSSGNDDSSNNDGGQNDGDQSDGDQNDGDQNDGGSGSDTGNNDNDNGNGDTDGNSGQVEDGYYVTVNGSSNNSGMSEADAWDIEFAFENASAGDIVYIKAGDYGNVRINADNSGTSSNPIRFIGYRDTPGDIVASSGSTFDYNGNAPSPQDMPLLKGQRRNMEGEGTGLSVLEDHIEISNIQIMYYKRGVGCSGDNTVLNNIIVYEVGDFNPAHSYPSGTNNAFLNYSGAGIVLSGNGTRLINSVVINAGAEGIRISGGDNQLHSDNEIYSDNNTNPMDYYYFMHNNADNNTIQDSYLFRKDGLTHNGHGLSLKAEASNNRFYNLEIVNTRIEVAKGRVENNLFKDCTITGSYDDGRSDGEGGILVANGANSNVFENVSIDNVRSAIRFADWNESSNGGFDEADAGNNNEFKNVTVTNALNGIYFDNFQEPEGSAHNNTFIDCEFSNLRRVFQVNRKNSENVFRNCNFSSIRDFEISSKSINLTLNKNTVFDDCTFSDVGFNPPN